VINLPRAVFDLSNNSASPLSWSVTTKALGGRGNSVVVSAIPLSAHSVDRIEVPCGGQDGSDSTCAPTSASLATEHRHGSQPSGDSSGNFLKRKVYAHHKRCDRRSGK
jgi:hypothetical protein